MQISQNLKLKQSQSLVMTPQLQQAIKLLQLNNLELTNLVNKELEENPFLENESIELEENNNDADDVTTDLTESYETGESNTDEAQCNEYENRRDTDTSYEFSDRGSAKESVDVSSVIEQTLSDSVTLKSILQSQADLEFESETNKKIAHILIVTKNKTEWSVELNKGTLPKITINEDYVKEIEKLSCGESDKKFINESLNSARWLMKAIQQRNITTLKISSEIVNQQKLFFEKGKKYLKPMVLKDVAKKINMHESTVSRVTSDKLMLTPRGVFEMKLFFSASISSTKKGETHSAESVRESLRKQLQNIENC